VKGRTGIGESSLSEFEAGKREPKLSQLSALARVYRRPVSFFLGEGPPPTETVLWRQRPESSGEELEARFLQLCRQYHNLEVWCDEELPLYLPQSNVAPDAFRYTDAKQLAGRVRGALELGDLPGPVLLSVLEEVCGVKVFHLDFQPTGSAACTLGDTSGAGVLLNAGTPRQRRNFDLAHELFHLLTWHVFRTSDTPCETAHEDKLGGCFARNLLMPDEPVRTALDRSTRNRHIPLDALSDVARQFGVSVDALLWKMHDLYGWTADATNKYSDAAKRRARQRDTRDDAKPPLLPERYHALAVRALARGEISIGRFAEYIGISRQKAMAYVEQEPTGDDEIQIGPV